MKSSDKSEVELDDSTKGMVEIMDCWGSIVAIYHLPPQDLHYRTTQDRPRVIYFIHC